MKVDIFQGHEPELLASDVNIVIDVIRAFTTASLAFEQGADKILLAGEVDEAHQLAEAHSTSLLAGERDAIKIEGFDVGNSPWAISRLDLSGRPVVLTTTNGVRATLHAIGAAHLLVTGFANARQTARYVRQLAERRGAGRVNIIASNPTGDDDLACAEFIRDRLLGRRGISAAEVVRRIRQSESAHKFLDPARTGFDRRDIRLCTTPCEAAFVMVASRVGGQPVVLQQDLLASAPQESKEAAESFE